MGKRKTEEDDQSMKKQLTTENMEEGASDVTPNEQSQSVKGMPLFPSISGLKGINKFDMQFTKKFYVKMYTNDYRSKFTAGTGSPPSVDTHELAGFMDVIPWQALAMYMSPDEYLGVVKTSSRAWLTNCGLQIKLMGIRTPFGANSEDVAQANGNLSFDIKRWDGLERMLPFEPADISEDASIWNFDKPRDYVDLITRLYGNSALSSMTIADIAAGNYPATMRQRSITYHPVWTLVKDTDSTNRNAVGPLYRKVNAQISTLPIGEYETDAINSAAVGYCFNKTYKPKNGLLCTTASAVCSDADHSNFGKVRANASNATENNFTTASEPISTNSAQFSITPKPRGYGYNYDILYYSDASIENTTFYENTTALAPIHNLPSMCIGVIPKINRDNSVVKATLEFEITTACHVSGETMSPTYMNLAKNPGSGAYLQSGLNDAIVMGSKWSHQESNTSITSGYTYANGYGLCGQSTYKPHTNAVLK